jgi:hypothetical protein
MKHSVYREISGVPGRAGNNRMGERILEAGAANLADAIWFHVTNARQCILN